jgi:alpha-D-ribose 1-methylphosphonate 5-triphosphate synthase subunit PhnH
MMLTTVPGFADRVHDAQQTFRALLDALARPGSLGQILPVPSPQGLMPACAAACLTLFDLETVVWLQPGLEASVASWLSFHTGCRFTLSPQAAHFAIIWDINTLPNLALFNWGSAERPESSATVLMQIPRLSQGEPVVLQGPGILQARSIAPELPQSFWQQWQHNMQAYPQGIDVFLFAQNQLMGLPRTVQLVHSTK